MLSRSRSARGAVGASLQCLGLGVALLLAGPAARAEPDGLCFRLPPDKVAIDGTSALSKGAAEAKCGSVLSLAAGTYSDDITLDQQCSADRPLVVTAEKPQGAVLAGRMKLTGSHLVVSGLKVDGGGIEVGGESNRLTRNLFNTGGGVVLRSARSRVDHNEFDTPGGGGIDLALKLSKNDRRPARENLIDHNYFHSSSRGGRDQGGDDDDERRPSVGIYIGEFSARKGRNDMLAYGGVGTTVEYNLFEDYERVHSIHVKSLGNVVRGNTVIRSSPRGNLSRVAIRHGQDNELTANYLSGGTTLILFEEHNRAIGNKLVDGAKLVVMAGGGEMTQFGGAQQRQAVDSLVAGNSGPLVIGQVVQRRANKAPAQGTIVEGHDGPIEKQLETDTIIRDRPSMSVPKAVKLTPGDVGLGAADARCP